MTPLLSKREAAATLGVGVRTLERMYASGELAHVRLRGRVLFEQSALTEYVQRRTVSAEKMRGMR